MASALDRVLSEYRSRPKDESGARKTKVSLIFDPTAASFTNSDTFYQIGFQGFTELCAEEPRLEKYGKTVFSYENSQMDPLFLTSEANENLSKKVKKLLYLLSDYGMNLATVKILEYLIQQYAVNRLHPDALLLSMLPYLETSFFVRITQTIPFQSLPKEFKYLRAFSTVAETKQPIDRNILIQIINTRPTVLQWILSGARDIAKVHPSGVFSSFVGVLMSETMLSSQDEVVTRAIIDTALNSLNEGDKAMAVQSVMAVASLNEKKTLTESLMKKFAIAISSNASILKEFYTPIAQASLYVFARCKQISIPPEFVIALSSNVEELKAISKKVDPTSLARSCIVSIVSNINNEDLARAGLVLMETEFFGSTAGEFLAALSNLKGQNEVSLQIIEKIVTNYPNAITPEILSSLKNSGVNIDLSTISKQQLINRLSESDAASLYTDASIPLDVAISQLKSTLISSKENPSILEPLFKYFSGRAPEELKAFVFENLLINSSDFSCELNKVISKYGSGIAPFLDGIPSDNQKILDFLSEKDLPNLHVFAFSAAKALHFKTSTLVEDFSSFLPINDAKVDSVIPQYIGSESDLATFIILTLRDLAKEVIFTPKTILKIFSFHSLMAIAPIAAAMLPQQLPNITAAFELSTKSDSRARFQLLSFFEVILPSVDPFSLLPSVIISLTDQSLTSISMSLLSNLPLKNKDLKNLIPKLRSQIAVCKSEDSIKTTLIQVAAHPKSRTFFDSIWASIQTLSGAQMLFSLSHDSGLISILPRLSGDLSSIFSDVIKVYPTSQPLLQFAISSRDTLMIRSAIPYLPLAEAVNYTCCFPDFFSKAFAELFANLDIEASALQPFFAPRSTIAASPIPRILPESFNPSECLTIQPSSLIAENLSGTNKVRSISSILPSLFSLLSVPSLMSPLFVILNSCVEDGWKYMIEHFQAIIDSVTKTTTPHIHSSALRLIQILSSKAPEVIASHATSIFSALSSTTLTQDDISNLTKLKSILSSILPPLSKTNAVEPFLNFISESIPKLSADRSSKIVISCIEALGGESYRTFSSLINHNQTDFCLLISDQIPQNSLLTALTKLVLTNPSSEPFITAVQIPPLPKQTTELFVAISSSFKDFEKVISSTMFSYNLSDFVKVSSELILTSISEAAHRLIVERIQKEPSPIYVGLLPSLHSQLKTKSSISDVLISLTEVASVIDSESSLPKVIATILCDIDSYPTVTKAQSLCFCATVVEKFQMDSLNVFPAVLQSCCTLYDGVVNDKLADLVPSMTGAVCLLLKSSPQFSVDDLPSLMPNLLSPLVLSSEASSLAVSCLSDLVKKLPLESLILSFINTFNKRLSDPQSLSELFSLLEKSLKSADSQSISPCVDLVRKFFILAFNVRCSDWSQMEELQKRVVDSFIAFSLQLNEQHFGLVFGQILRFFETATASNQSDCVVSRVFCVKAVGSLAEQLKEAFSRYYSAVLPLTLQFCSEADDKDAMGREVTKQCCRLFVSIGSFAEKGFFNTERFSNVLSTIMKHCGMVEGRDEYIEKVENGVAPAVAALMGATKDDMMWRSVDREILQRMKSKVAEERIGSLKIVETAFKRMGSEISGIIPEILPLMNELLEDPNHEVEAEVRTAMKSIEEGIGESIQTYME